jgi:hypothetical protein
MDTRRAATIEATKNSILMAFSSSKVYVPAPVCTECLFVFGYSGRSHLDCSFVAIQTCRSTSDADFLLGCKMLQDDINAMVAECTTFSHLPDRHKLALVRFMVPGAYANDTRGPTRSRRSKSTWAITGALCGGGHQASQSTYGPLLNVNVVPSETLQPDPVIGDPTLGGLLPPR